MQINASFRSPMRSKEDMHIDTISAPVREVVLRWLDRCGVQLGSVDADGKEVEFGVTSNFSARSIANLNYFKDFEESRPAWPYPLDPKIIRQNVVEYHEGFGL